MYSGVPSKWAETGLRKRVHALRRRRLGDAEVDDPRRRLPVRLGHEDVGRLEVAVDDAAQVRVLHAVADLRKEREPRPQLESVFLAIAVDRRPVDVLHREVWPPVVGRAGIEDARDVRVREHRQRLALELEARDDVARTEPELDDLDRDLAPDRLALLGEEDLAHGALAESLQHLVGADLARHSRAARAIRGSPRARARPRRGS
jgi:hypothetical protein